MKGFLVTALLLLFSLHTRVEAADLWHTSTLKWVYPVANGSFILAFNLESASCPSPSSPKYFNVVVGENGVTEEAARKFYAAAMAALVTRMTVQVNFSDSSSACFINRMLVLAE